MPRVLTPLRLARVLQGKTLVELAREVGSTPPTLSRAERGIGPVSPQLIARIYRALAGAPRSRPHDRGHRGPWG